MWLTPEQVAILPISEKYNDYANTVCKYFEEKGVRAQVDDRNEKIGRKIRDNELKRVPYMVIVGEQEQAQGTLSIRKDGVNVGSKTVEEFVDWFKETVKAELS